MFIPNKYLNEDWEAQEQIIKSNPLGTVITFSEEDGLIANHIPFYLKVDEKTGKKYLQAHLAKVNPQLKSLKNGKEVLIVFKSVDSYITPSYYPTKAETHKVVPTWDFGAVHCYGIPTIIDDPIWVREQLNHLSDQQEADRVKPWKVNEAPENYLQLLQKSICGLEIEISKIESKLKFEQKMKRQDIDGVIEGLKIDNKPEVSDYVKICNPQN